MGFTNPVYGKNFADPQVVAVDNIFYAFATNGALGNVQTLTSTDLVSWDEVGDALPVLPSWTSPGRVWAPEVAVHAADRYVMYYTSRDDVSDRQAVGVAVASVPEGPYVDKSSQPLISQVDEGGSIDASPFQDSTGRRWLYWKNDGKRDRRRHVDLRVGVVRRRSHADRPGASPDQAGPRVGGQPGRGAVHGRT